MKTTAIYFTYNGQKYMITSDWRYGFRVTDDAHGDRRLFVEDCVSAFKSYYAWQDEQHQAAMDEQASLDAERQGLW